MKNIAVFATFRDKLHAETGVKELINGGFRSEDIAVLVAENVGSKDLAHERHSKAPEGAATGGSAGAIVGGTLGLLAGLGTIVLPGIQQFLTAGPVMDSLAGAGAVGVLGAILGAVIGLGTPEFEAKRYRGLIKEGRSLLSVHCETSEGLTLARHILKSVGGQGVVSANESTAGFAADSKTRVRYGNAHWSVK
jgi:hypothetical protein